MYLGRCYKCYSVFGVGAMFALVDCNSFYVSCERIFQPRLEREPVIVLSSNDGCAIARSQEAKAIGIPMGAPFFKIRHLVEKHGVHVFSPNFSLYGNFSSRVMSALQAFSSALEIYSIDEAFLDLSSVPQHELFSYGCHIKKIVKQWTGIPVSVGIAPTKTLAKVASAMAKRHPAGCYTLLDSLKIDTLLRNFPLQDVWGVGHHSIKKLSSLGLNSALDLACMDIRHIRQTFNVVLARTALELRGISCLSLKEISAPKKNLLSSRSFGSPVTAFEDLREAVSFHASSLAQRLRQEGSKTSLLSVSIKTNRFDKKGGFYHNTHLIPLPYPSHENSLLIKASTLALKKIFRENLSYKKVGVTALNLIQKDQETPSLFKDMKNQDCSKKEGLLQAIDGINYRHGKDTLIFASEGLKKPWQSKSSWKSPSFLSQWDQLPKVS